MCWWSGWKVCKKKRVEDTAKILEEWGCTNQDEEVASRAGYRTLLEAQVQKCHVWDVQWTNWSYQVGSWLCECVVQGRGPSWRIYLEAISRQMELKPCDWRRSSRQWMWVEKRNGPGTMHGGLQYLEVRNLGRNLRKRLRRSDKKSENHRWALILATWRPRGRRRLLSLLRTLPVLTAPGAHLPSTASQSPASVQL